MLHKRRRPVWFHLLDLLADAAVFALQSAVVFFGGRRVISLLAVDTREALGAKTVFEKLSLIVGQLLAVASVLTTHFALGVVRDAISILVRGTIVVDRMFTQQSFEHIWAGTVMSDERRRSIGSHLLDLEALAAVLAFKAAGIRLLRRLRLSIHNLGIRLGRIVDWVSTILARVANAIVIDGIGTVASELFVMVVVKEESREALATVVALVVVVAGLKRNVAQDTCPC
jgi:hypothetical protein